MKTHHTTPHHTTPHNSYLSLVCYYLLISVLATSVNDLAAQPVTIKGDCTGLSITAFLNPGNYRSDLYMAFTLGKGESECWGQNEIAECRAVSAYQPAGPRYMLQRQLADGSWQTVATRSTALGVLTNVRFNELDHGTYRVQAQIPIINFDFCATFRGPVTPTCIYDYSGRYVGFAGIYEGTLSGTGDVFTSNTVIVGATNALDNTYLFAETNTSGSEASADENETVSLDLSQTRNYDLYWIAVQESGPTSGNWATTGWQTGSIQSFNLSAFWFASTSGPFRPFHSYKVHYVNENLQCRNGIEWPAPLWNIRTRDLFICPAGTGCLRLNAEDYSIKVYPNPTTDLIRIGGLEKQGIEGARVRLFDALGRMVDEEVLQSDAYDMSSLEAGTYNLQIWRENVLIHAQRVALLR